MLTAIDNTPLLLSSMPGIVAGAVSDGIIVKIFQFIHSEIRSFKPTQIWRCYVLWGSIWTLFILIPLLLGSLGMSHSCSLTHARTDSEGVFKYAFFTRPRVRRSALL